MNPANSINPQAPSALQGLRADVQSMQAYAIQDSRGMIKLDAMENPYDLDADLQAKLGQRLGHVAMNRYPGQRVDDLKQALGAYTDLPQGMQLMLGNGSDELIGLLAMAFCKAELPLPERACILAPLPGFVMYEMSAQLQGLRFVGVDLTPDFELDSAAMLAAIEQHQPEITYLAYPNNPTANLWDAKTMQDIIMACAQYGGVVVIDEAYQPFSSRTWLDEIRQHRTANRNVLLMRTLSKFGLAGIRIGYLCGDAPLIDQIDKLRPPYNVSSLNAEAALFALEHRASYEAQASHIRRERDKLFAALQAIPRVTPYKTDANMLLLRVHNADALFIALKNGGVLVKNVSKMHALLAQCLRLTVGTPSENEKLIQLIQHHV